MTEREALLKEFLDGYDPPARDPAFVAAAMTKLNRRLAVEHLTLLGAAGVALAVVLAFGGPAFLAPLERLSPVAAPIAMLSGVLMVMRFTPRRRVV